MIELMFYAIGVLLVAAGIYLRADGSDYAFVAVILGCCSAFLGYRTRLKRRVDERTKLADHTPDDLVQ